MTNNNSATITVDSLPTNVETLSPAEIMELLKTLEDNDLYGSLDDARKRNYLARIGTTISELRQDISYLEAGIGQLK